MASAVADRVDVAQRLLQAAGPGVAPMVAATNRYGQVLLALDVSCMLFTAVASPAALLDF